MSTLERARSSHESLPELHAAFVHAFSLGEYEAAATIGETLLRSGYAAALNDVFFLAGACFRKGLTGAAARLLSILLTVCPNHEGATELASKIVGDATYRTTDNPIVPPVQVAAYRVFATICSGSVVLEVGCGLGLGSHILSASAATVVASDIEITGLSHAREKYGAARAYVNCSGSTLPFASKSFDYVTCVDVIEHIPDFHRAIDEMKRVARRGVLISTPNRLPEYTNPDGSPRNYWHLFEWSPSEISQVMSQHFPSFQLSYLHGTDDAPTWSAQQPEDRVLALLINASPNEVVRVSHPQSPAKRISPAENNVSCPDLTPTNAGRRGVRYATRVHFVYAGNPQNDDVSTAPEVITNHVFRFLEQRTRVTYSDWLDTKPIEVAEDDVLLGHPHPDPTTPLYQAIMNATCRAKFLLFPFHHGMPEINLPFDPLVRRCTRLFAITGEYWADTIGSSPFSHWKDKFTRIDMAVDTTRFPHMKTSFHPQGQRVLLYVGNDRPEKGVSNLAHLVRDTGCQLIYVGSIGPSRHLFDGLDVRFTGPMTLSRDTLRQLAQVCDFFINMSVSDANPTTILEMSSIGLPVLCTKESGYTRSDVVYPLSLSDHQHNVAVVNALQQASHQGLMERSHQVARIVQREYTWERFCHTIFEGMEQYL